MDGGTVLTGAAEAMGPTVFEFAEPEPPGSVAVMTARR